MSLSGDVVAADRRAQVDIAIGTGQGLPSFMVLCIITGNPPCPVQLYPTFIRAMVVRRPSMRAAARTAPSDVIVMTG
ncbi:hypothetical protein [Mycolicibacterium baixiangningiae]|uniref:hypothetical protein n=1 Tax=Mycolicibacterium baixiangningiae TaxID=2761578 RepID=UPI0018D1DB21|nr:hypothetical protein [Mycolicibacterium baixiangningiae]